MLNNRQLVQATVVGTILQVAMVVAGHLDHAITNLFAVGGMGFSLVAGLVYGRLARTGGKGGAVWGGVIAGAVCAFIGILISALLGDVPTSLLLLGTVSSAVTGAIGGFAGTLGGRSAATAAGLTALAIGSAALPLRAHARSVASAPVTLADFAWLTGTWRAEFPGSPAVAEVTYIAPKGGVILGVMRLVSNDTVRMIELISMVQTPSGLELRFRHFNAALAVLEQEFKQTLRLAHADAGSAEFDNAVPFDKALMSTEARNAIYTRHGNDEYVAHSDVIGADRKPDVIELTYRRVK